MLIVIVCIHEEREAQKLCIFIYYIKKKNIFF